jgi:hypothetical protein
MDVTGGAGATVGVMRSLAAGTTFVLLAVGATACGSSSKSAVPTTTTAGSPTTVAVPTSVIPTATTAVSRSASNAKDWDLDGDGRADAAHLVYLGSGEWDLVADMTALGTQRVEFSAIPPQNPARFGPRIIGAVDPNGEGHADVFVQVDHGASNAFWTIFTVTDKRLRQVTVGGQPIRLNLYGPVVSLSGFSCAGPDLNVYEASLNNSGADYNWTRRTYRWVGSQLMLQVTTSGTTSAAGSSTYSLSSCGDLPTADT